MGKTGKWLKSFLVGKKQKDKDKPASSTRSSKERKRWSFRRSARKEMISTPLNERSEAEMDQERHTVVVAIAAAPAVEEAAAVKIQTAFRGYLARKAVCALQGLVKLQAFIRGHLVRKQTSAALWCLQALATAQARARDQRIRMLEEALATPQRQPNHRRSPKNSQNKPSHDMDKVAEENIKIVEMDLGEARSILKSRYSYSTPRTERTNHRFSSYVGNHRASCKSDGPQQVSPPSPSALTNISPRACSAIFEEFSFNTAQNSPYYLSSVSLLDQRKSSYSMSHYHPFYPNYMANTESSRAKARSRSAPKQRPDIFERPPSRRKSNIPRSGHMQRSASHVGATAQMHYQWSLKLDRSSVSLKDSECGSNLECGFQPSRFV